VKKSRWRPRASKSKKVHRDAVEGKIQENSGNSVALTKVKSGEKRAMEEETSQLAGKKATSGSKKKFKLGDGNAKDSGSESDVDGFDGLIGEA
jgi:hypothetical protein